MKADHTPKYIKSKTALGLQRLMLENNLRRKGWHRYEIVHDGKDWYAWYYINLAEPTAIIEINEGEK